MEEERSLFRRGSGRWIGWLYPPRISARLTRGRSSHEPRHDRHPAETGAPLRRSMRWGHAEEAEGAEGRPNMEVEFMRARIEPDPRFPDDGAEVDQDTEPAARST